MNLEIPYEKAGAEKPESAAQLVCCLQQPQNMPVPRQAVVICQAAVIATPHQESQNP